VRQVGAFGVIAIKSSTNFDNMIFPMGSIFIFRSWVCKVDNKGNLHGHLIEALEAHKDLTLSTKLIEDLEKLPDNNQSRSDIRVGFLLGVLSRFFQRQAKSFSNWTLEHSIDSTRDQFESTLGFFQEVELLPNWT
jgi:hypothetical protein